MVVKVAAGVGGGALLQRLQWAPRGLSPYLGGQRGLLQGQGGPQPPMQVFPMQQKASFVLKSTLLGFALSDRNGTIRVPISRPVKIPNVGS